VDEKFEHPPPDNCGTCFYTYESAPGIEFWYPIPIPDGDTEGTMPPQTRYLFCDTHRAYFHVRLETADERSPNRLHAFLQDGTGTALGHLYMHHANDRKLFDFDLPIKRRIEVVAISRGSRLRTGKDLPLTGIEHQGQSEPSLRYTFYNVLWIEWEDGIAYRRGKGTVREKMWRKQNPEPLSLVLG
jgi:hypothetical protein